MNYLPTRIHSIIELLVFYKSLPDFWSRHKLFARRLISFRFDFIFVFGLWSFLLLDDFNRDFPFPLLHCSRSIPKWLGSVSLFSFLQFDWWFSCYTLCGWFPPVITSNRLSPTFHNRFNLRRFFPTHFYEKAQLKNVPLFISHFIYITRKAYKWYCTSSVLKKIINNS